MYRTLPSFLPSVYYSMSQEVSDEEDNERSLVEGLHPDAPITVEILTELLKAQGDSLTQKLEKLEERLDEKLEKLEERLDERLEERLDEKLEPINLKLDHLDRKLDHLVAASPHAAMTIEQNHKDMARGIVDGRCCGDDDQSGEA